MRVGGVIVLVLALIVALAIVSVLALDDDDTTIVTEPDVTSDCNASTPTGALAVACVNPGSVTPTSTCYVPSNPLYLPVCPAADGTTFEPTSKPTPTPPCNVPTPTPLPTHQYWEFMCNPAT